MNLFFIILSFSISAGIAWLILPRILMISLQKKLFDMPAERKIHKRAIPRLGGVSFFPTILLSCCAVLAIRTLTGYDIPSMHSTHILLEYLLLVCGMVLLYLTGIADDLVGVRYRQKLIIQMICACLFPIAGFWINDLYGLFGVYSLPVWIGIPFTVLIVIFITNAINLIDGIDGLASGLSIIALIVLGYLFAEKRLWGYSMLALSTFGVLIPFFYYNVFGSAERARKIFMGDTGSLTLGYILSFLAIKYSQNCPDTTPYTDGALIIAFSTLIIPAFDVIRVVLIRIRNGRSPFFPDRNHIHHKFLAIGFTPRKAMISILLLSCGFIAVNILLMPYLNNTLIFFFDVAVWIGLHLRWNKILSRHINN